MATAQKPTPAAEAAPAAPIQSGPPQITVGAETYRLVLNLDDTNSHSLTDSAWGLSGVNFAPGEVKCFKASAPTVDIFGL
ncbi:hypothetical protein [Phenylobacterium sp.]|jgi:hypothetical protein|uniref:hypothetical protein n=1 Tax=Phenylobacterium sp. TaxID=1871053 RepID=UPI002E340C0B|nr:hypothetical protein [Phenylobacterium sp.]HEX3367406.1 hypothetical protein [Phenylobacterium sp.]